MRGGDRVSFYQMLISIRGFFTLHFGHISAMFSWKQITSDEEIELEQRTRNDCTRKRLCYTVCR
jgi:hypothetical protein